MSVQLKGTKYFEKAASEEYIVNIEEITKKFQETGLYLISQNPFETYSKNFKKEWMIMNDDEKNYSSMNTVLIYQYKK